MTGTVLDVGRCGGCSRARGAAMKGMLRLGIRGLQLEGIKMRRLADTFIGGSEYLLSRAENNSGLCKVRRLFKC